MPDRVLMRSIANLGSDPIPVRNDPAHLNARSESLIDTWLCKGAYPARCVDRIASLYELGNLVVVPEDMEVMTIVTKDWDNKDDYAMKIVTRADGWTFHRQLGVYPTGTNKNIADWEHTIHHRWPVYIPRIQ